MLRDHKKAFFIFLVFILLVILFENDFVLSGARTSEEVNKDKLVAEKHDNQLFLYAFNNPVALDAIRKSYASQQKTFEACPLDQEANLEIDNFVEVNQSTSGQKESYKLTLGINKVEQMLLRFNSTPHISNCTLEKIWKKPNKPESVRSSALFRGKPLALTRQNLTITLNQSGSYHLKCFSRSDQKRILFEHVYNVLPLNVTRLKDFRREDKLNVQKMEDPWRNSTLVRDLEFTECGAPPPAGSTKPVKRTNILLIGMDSVSYNQMRRIFPLTYDYLDRDLEDNVIFDNFNSVGENTFPNHVAMLCGLAESREISRGNESDIAFLEKIQAGRHHDHYPFIWKRFDELGYVTMYQVDDPSINIFNYLKHGFLYSPTDVYNRAFNVQLHLMRKQASRNKICYHQKPVYRDFYDKIEQFVSRMRTPPNADTPYFSMTFLSELTHDSLTVPKGYDIRMRDLIKKLHNTRSLENTMLIVYGDHGHRLSHFGAYTDIGRYERSRPFLSVHLPKSFRNTSYMENLKSNRHKLATFFAVYQILRQIEFLDKFNVDLSNESSPANGHMCREQFRVNDPRVRSKRGVSLLEELAANRSCEEALILEKFCRNYKRIAVNEGDFRRLTNYTQETGLELVVDQINSMFARQKELCELYRLEKVNSFHMVKSQREMMFQIVLEVSPGESLFDAGLYLDKKGKLRVKGKPVRLSLYGDQSHCINDNINKNYCFCKKVKIV